MASVDLLQVSMVRDGTTTVDAVTLSIAEGELLAIVGPSGAGKSTLLRLVAGLDTPTSGEIRFDGDDVTRREPAERNVAMVFQDGALYPTMTARKNVGFPLRLAGVSAEEIERRVVAESRVLEIERLLERYPGQLSAGHRQLVEAARAMVRVPALFLMDEPLSRLDGQLRIKMRTELRLLQRGYRVTTLYVTNDQTEGMAMADRLAVMREGRLVQVGRPLDVYHRPVDRFVAGFIGTPPMSIVPGRVAPHSAGGVTLVFGGFSQRVWARELTDRRDVEVGVRPEHVLVDETGAEAEVVAVEDHGSELLVGLAGAGVELTMRVAGGTAASVGDRVRVRVDHLHVFDPGTGVAIAHV